MYSVLIQNQKTMESFRHFYPLFLDAVNYGRVGVCQWMEAGDTVETAVPELYQLVDDKEEWRAIIVRIDDETDEDHLTVQGNPYDFLENTDADTSIKESSIPLVRLTRLLGGIPSPPIRFEPEMIQEPNKAPRVIYKPSVDEKEQMEYRRLSEKYHFRGAPPTEIILVSLTNKREAQAEDIKKAWRNDKETTSSEFWRRNGYPSACRFTVYEMEQKGDRQREADLFKVWASVLLLATNEVDSSTLQAYRLHRLDVVFEKKVMSEVMQRTLNRAKNAKQYIKKSIQKEMTDRLTKVAPLPDYELEAPVVLNLPRQNDLTADEHSFGLTSKTESSDLAKWSEMKSSAEKSLETAVLEAERALDHTADKVRMYCNYLPDEVHQLDLYQHEDLERELVNRHETILNLRSELPDSNAANKKTIAELDRSIKEKLLKRVTKSQAVLCCALVSAITIASFISAVVYHLKYQWGSWSAMLCLLLVCVAALFLVEAGALWLFRNDLRRSIRQFNKFTNSVVARIAENGARYSRYMGNIASHIHGSSYLLVLQRKTFMRDESEYYKRNHLAALDAFALSLEDWCTAFHLPVDFGMEEMNEGLTVNTEVAPYMNPIYTFDDAGSHSVEVNRSGDFMDSPFSFIKKITIVREELYDGDE